MRGLGHLHPVTLTARAACAVKATYLPIRSIRPHPGLGRHPYTCDGLHLFYQPEATCQPGSFDRASRAAQKSRPKASRLLENSVHGAMTRRRDRTGRVAGRGTAQKHAERWQKGRRCSGEVCSAWMGWWRVWRWHTHARETSAPASQPRGRA